MEKLQLKVITPNGMYFEGEVNRVDVKTTNGYMGIMANHIPLVGNIVPSKLTIASSKDEQSAISGGVIYIEKDGVTIISDAIESTNEIDVARAKAAKERAEKRLAGKSQEEKVDFARAQAALERAINRINLKG